MQVGRNAFGNGTSKNLKVKFLLLADKIFIRNIKKINNSYILNVWSNQGLSKVENSKAPGKILGSYLEESFL